MTYLDHIKEIWEGEFKNRHDLGSFLGVMAAIFSIVFIMCTIIAIASGSFSAYIGLAVVFGGTIVVFFTCFFSYTFIYWLVNRKDM